MNKKSKNTTDVSDAYRNLSFNKTAAPIKPDCTIKSRVIKTGADLRSKGGK